MDKDQARAFLSDVPKGKEFYLVNGDKLSNLKDFRNALHLIDDTLFRYHVNEHHNDFQKWILEVVKDTVLSHKLDNVIDLEEARKIVDKRVDGLIGILEKEYEKKMKQYEASSKTKNKHSDEYYKRKEERMKNRFHDMIVKEFFYGMATGIFLAFILLRMFQLLR